jgi:transcriptional regulator with PAS, ATPase and Fis domain
LTDELLKVERRILMKAMQKCRSTSELALKLNISQPTAFRKMRKHNLQFKNE